MFVKDWFRELNFTGLHILGGADINFATASVVKSFIYIVMYLSYCQKTVSRMYFWCICLNVRKICQFTISKQIVVISNISLQHEILRTKLNKSSLTMNRQMCFDKLVSKEITLIVCKILWKNMNCESLLNYNWQTEGAGQIVVLIFSTAYGAKESALPELFIMHLM